VNTTENLRESLKAALHTCDWLQAIASAREILELEPDALRERYLLAQLYLRVSGSRLATVQFRKVQQQAVRRRELWKAVAAQKALDSLAGGAPENAYGQIFSQVVRGEGEAAGGRFPRVLERLTAETFDRICRDMQLVTLLQNERWPVPGGGASLMVTSWGRAWLEREEESIEAAEGEILFVVPPDSDQAVEVVALEETALLHLAPDALSGFTAEVPGLENLAAPAERPAEAAVPEAPPGPLPEAAPEERDDVLFAARLVVHVEGEQDNVTLPGLVSGLNEAGACFECESALLPVDPASLEGATAALQVGLKTSERAYRWIGRLDWVRPRAGGPGQGFQCSVRWDSLTDEDRAAVNSLRGARGSEAHRLWELWNSSLGTDR